MARVSCLACAAHISQSSHASSPCAHVVCLNSPRLLDFPLLSPQSQVVRKIDSSEIRRISFTPRCRRKDTPRLRQASNLAEARKQPETVRLPRGGGDEADPHLAREPFLKCGDTREPLIKRNGVYFVKAPCVRARDSQNHA